MFTDISTAADVSVCPASNPGAKILVFIVKPCAAASVWPMSLSEAPTSVGGYRAAVSSVIPLNDFSVFKSSGTDSVLGYSPQHLRNQMISLGVWVAC